MSQFFQIPALIMFHKKLTSDDKIVFSIIYGYLKKNKTCWYTNEELMEVTGRSRRQIDIILNRLESEKIIERVGCGYRRKFALGSFLNNCAENIVDRDAGQELNNYAENALVLRRKRSSTAQKTTQYCAENVVENREQNKENNKEQQPSPSEPSPEKPQPSKPDTVVVVFSKTVDQQLLDFVFKLPTHLQPSFTSSNLELLNAFKFHVDFQIKTEQISFDFAINKLKKLMRSHKFQKPDGFESQIDIEKSKQIKMESEQWIISMAEESRKKGTLDLKPVTAEQVAQVKSLGLGSIFKTMLQ